MPLPLLWRDPTSRTHTFDAPRTALRRSDSAALSSAIQWIDNAVIAALQDMGLPRGEIFDIEIDDFGRGWAGRKVPDCRLLLDRTALLRALSGVDYPDEALRVWVHKSIHARHPYARGHGGESAHTAGYEEGLVESLTQLVMHAGTRMRFRRESYAAYVAAYAALSSAATIDVEALPRTLWRTPPGDTRARFVDTVDEARRLVAHQPLSGRQRVSLQAVGDRLFATSRGRERAGETDVLIRTWQVGLR